jgi:putative methyltransferase (TIGR04325 family)
MKNLIKQFLPPILLKGFHKSPSQKNHEQWSGNFTTWEIAEQNSSGYDDDSILTECKNALLKVKSGEAVYERDSVIFEKKEYNLSLLACLQAVAMSSHGRLSVLDFGGSLGSSYYQSRDFLSSIKNVQWSIVEQAHFVECGKVHFENEELRFYHLIQDVVNEMPVTCILLSGVLQYIKDPSDLIRQILDYNFEFIIIDRTGFISDHESVITIQNVPEQIYKASYPCWFFNEKEFLELFGSHYQLITDFDDRTTMPYYLNEDKCYWKGYFLKNYEQGQFFECGLWLALSSRVDKC